jgi:hypothetical protein
LLFVFLSLPVRTDADAAIMIRWEKVVKIKTTKFRPLSMARLRFDICHLLVC